MRVWTSPTSFVEVSADKGRLTDEFASRERSLDFASMLMVLPDPDPILKKQGKDITVYKDLICDAHVDSVVQSRTSGVLRREWRVEPGGESSQEARLAEATEAALRDVDMDALLEGMMDAPFYGAAYPEVMWAEIGGLLLPQAIVCKPQEWFCYGTKNELRFKSKDNWQGEETPPMKFMVVRNRATYANPYGERALSRCFWPVTIKRAGFKWWVVFVEKYGLPFLVGKLPRTATAKQYDTLLDKLEAMVHDAVAVVPDDATVEINAEASNSASASIFDRMIASCNAEISKAIVGQTLTTEIGETGGAYAASQTHQEVRSDLLDRDARMIAGAFDLLFRWVRDLNDPAAAAPRWKWHEEEDLGKDRADRDNILAPLLEKSGNSLTVDYYKKNYNLTDEDIEEKAPAPEPVPGAAGFMPGMPGVTPPQLRPFVRATRNAVPGDEEAEFAEGPTDFEAYYKRLEELAKKAAAEAQAPLEDLVKQVRLEVERGRSLADVVDRLHELYPKLDVDKMRDVMARAGFSAEVLGRFSNEGVLPPVGFEMLPPEEAMKYLKDKGMTLSWNWTDVWQEQHAKAFTVAHLQKLDVLQDVRNAVQDAIDSGSTVEEFKEKLQPILETKGWWGRQEGVNPKTGEAEMYTAGTPWRLENIYRTNLNVAYSVGRYHAQKENTAAAPYWQYMAVMDNRTRPDHAALNGKVFKASDPIWDRIYPPNGWGCRCGVVALSENQVSAQGLTVAKGRASDAIADDDWDYNPAKAGLEADLAGYDPKFAEDYRTETKS